MNSGGTGFRGPEPFRSPEPGSTDLPGGSGGPGATRVRGPRWLRATTVPALADGACQVWWARPGYARPGHDALLHDDERGRRERLRRAADRDRLTVGYALARVVLAAHLGTPTDDVGFTRTCRHCAGPHGKPYLATADDQGLRFSISHAGDRVVVAVVRGTDVGVDVEEVAPGLEVDVLADSVLSADEDTPPLQADATARVRAFLTYWTRKEALLKSTGDGLRVPMTHLTVSGPDAPPRLRAWAGAPNAPSRFHLYDLNPGSGHVAALSIVDRPATETAEFDGADLLA